MNNSDIDIEIISYLETKGAQNLKQIQFGCLDYLSGNKIYGRLKHLMKIGKVVRDNNGRFKIK